MKSDDYVGSIFAFAGTYAPVNYAFCGGGVIAIVDHTVLFALVWTTFGGDGRTSLGLPDLRGRAALGAGTGPGLAPCFAGYLYGFEEEYAQMDELHLPPHTHTGGFTASDLNSAVQSSVQAGSTVVSGRLYCRIIDLGQNSPLNAYPGTTGNPALDIWATAHNNTTTAAIPVVSPQIDALPMSTTMLSNTISASVGSTGSGDAFQMTSMPPSQVCMYVIATDGLFPPRS